ncbi:MAG: ImmA/IrrE family metallo-endopeptidase [Tannerella sp.]|nr:ImmA/IrrE family metallo-endopeptidase [Tannerella sp.]
MKSVKKIYDGNSPYRPAEALDIEVLYFPLEDLRGFFTNFNRVKIITLSNKLDKWERHSALFHEIGHACIHEKEVLDMPGAAAFLQKTSRRTRVRD